MMLDGSMDIDDPEEEEEDEETLQLRLQEIQAKLRLKKLQKSKEASQPPPSMPRSHTTSSLGRASAMAGGRAAANIAGLREERAESRRTHTAVEVPVSPIKRAPPPDVNRSPSRVLMGIDKGRKASEISLRRAPILRKPTDELMDNVRRAGSYLHRTNSQPAPQDPFMAAPSLAPTQARPVSSFSERMAKVRDDEAAQRAKAARLKTARSKAFDIDQKQMESMKAEAVPLPETKYKEPEFNRDQILGSISRAGGGLLAKSKSVSNLNSAIPRSTTMPTSMAPPRTSSQTSVSRPRARSPNSSFGSTPSGETPTSSQTGVEYESFSSTHLSKRIIPHRTLTRTLSGKTTYTLKELLADVKSPEYQFPDEVEGDVVVLAVLANKSEPKTQKAGLNPGQKFMILTLCDLKYEVDLFLFGGAFTKYWKLTPGNVVAILNPQIMKPLKADTGRFSLVINSDDDTILEIGASRDLGYCKSIKKDGNQCDAWIDKRHTEFCEFHVNEQLRKTKSGRMEVNTMDFGRAGAGSGEKWKPRSQNVTGYQDRAARARAAKLEKEGGKHTNWLGETTYIHKNAAHFDNEVSERVEKAERTRKRFAAEERERELASKLGTMGTGLGADYMKRKAAVSQSFEEQPRERDAFWNPPPPPDAKALGLLSGKASEVSLAPMKRKRANTTSTNSNSGVSEARGWGGALSKDLGRMRDGERLMPVKKKTRFVTAKGIREAGRESFGGDMAEAQGMVSLDDDDDDDDLDIIR